MLNEYGDQLTHDEKTFWENAMHDYQSQLEKGKSDEQ